MSDVYNLITAQPGFVSPFFDVVTCNNVIVTPKPVTSKLFVLATSTGGGLPLVSTTSPANIAIIPNPSMSLATNRYTAPANQYLMVTVSYQLVPPPLGAVSAVNQCTVLINGGTTYIGCSCYVGVNVSEPFTVQACGVIPLIAGDVVSVSFVNNGFTGGWLYRNFSFSGVVL